MRLYLKYLSIHIRSAMEYKMSFLLTALGQFLTAFGMFLTIYFMFERFHEVKDFTYPQVLLCFSIVMMAFSIAEIFARGFDTFSSMISNGEFDRIMVRPRNEIFQVLASKAEFTRLGRIFQAVLIFIYAIPSSGIDWTPFKILVMILMILGGAVFFSGMFMIYAAISFFTIEALEFMNIFTDGAREYGRYPISIYGEKVLKFLTYVIPVALFQYYPLLYLIDKSDQIFYGFLPIISMLFVVPCWLIWKFGVKKYKSTGS